MGLSLVEEQELVNYEILVISPTALALKPGSSSSS